MPLSVDEFIGMVAEKLFGIKRLSESEQKFMDSVRDKEVTLHIVGDITDYQLIYELYAMQFKGHHKTAYPYR